MTLTSQITNNSAISAAHTDPTQKEKIMDNQQAIIAQQKAAVCEGGEFEGAPDMSPIEFGDVNLAHGQLMGWGTTDPTSTVGVYPATKELGEYLKKGYRSYVTVEYEGECVGMSLSDAYRRHLREVTHYPTVETEPSPAVVAGVKLTGFLESARSAE